jgi:IMP dehydrogenase
MSLMNPIHLALTYDDVLLVPRFSGVQSRRQVDTATRFTRQIALKTPFISANMDTVTEASMAIAVAEFGGIGVIHRFLPTEAQVAEVARVKRYQSEVIEEPYTISLHATLSQARELMRQHGISGLPVVDESHRLLGILTSRDLRFADDSAPVSERMTPRERLIVAPPDVSREQAQAILSQHRLEKLPLVDREGRLAGLITAKDLSKNLGLSQATRDEKGRLRVAAAVGVANDFLERAQELVNAGVDALVIDIAHGDSALMLSAVGQLRERLGDVPLVAGNVATTEATERLIKAGVDAVKVGVGPGSMCITRQVAGVGVPQFTAVLESAQVAHQHGVPVIADGGIRYPGDVAKAIGAGASTVMLGNLLAGTDESPGVIVSRSGQKMKVARGMASMEAALDRTLRDDPEHGWARWESTEAEVAAEGIQAPVPYRGTAREVLQQLLAGLRSGMSYCGSNTIEEMWRNARFVQQTEAGFRESGPHDVGSF